MHFTNDERDYIYNTAIRLILRPDVQWVYIPDEDVMLCFHGHAYYFTYIPPRLSVYSLDYSADYLFISSAEGAEWLAVSGLHQDLRRFLRKRFDILKPFYNVQIEEDQLTRN